MAKQPKTPAAPAPTAPANTETKTTKAPGAQAIARAQAAAADIVKIVLKDDKAPDMANVKIAPQCKVIVNCVASFGAEGVTREKLVAALVPAGLQTRQPAGRIFSYYQKSLVEGGYITITAASPASAAPVAA